MEEIEKMLDEKFEKDMQVQLDKHYDLTQFPRLTREQIRNILGDKRFDMTGFDEKPGTCTVHNLEVLNEFAKFGIHDYTEFIVLDFWKGTATVILKYLRDKEVTEYDLTGLSTSNIILRILELTVYSNKPKRVRI